MTVYLIADNSNTRVKSGYTTSNVQDRLNGLQAGNPEPLVLLREIEGGPTTEKWLHKQFHEHRIVREWFAFHPDMLTVMPPTEPQAPQPQPQPQPQEPERQAPRRPDVYGDEDHSVDYIIDKAIRANIEPNGVICVFAATATALARMPRALLEELAKPSLKKRLIARVDDLIAASAAQQEQHEKRLQKEAKEAARKMKLVDPGK